MVVRYAESQERASRERQQPTTGAEPDRVLAVFMLSSFRVVVNGTSLNGRLRAKGRDLLKILAAHRERVLPRDVLLEMLWPEADPSTAAVSLKVAAHNLRGVLEPDKENGSPGSWVVCRDGTYSLNPQGRIWIDVECLEEHWKNGRASEARGDLAAARREFEAAEQLYAGDFLEEDIYEDWTIVRRERLRDLYLELVSKLAEMAAGAGDHRDVVRYCHRIIDADPCREDAYRMLMQAHGALNQPARAGAWYAVCRSMLKREIGVDPSPETCATFDALFD